MTILTDAEEEFLGIHDAVSYQFFPGQHVAENIDINDSVSVAYLAGASISESIGLTDVASIAARYRYAFNELLSIHPSLAAAVLIAISDGVKIHDAMVIARGVLIAQRLGMQDVLTGAARLHVTVAENLDLATQLLWFLGGTLHDNLLVSETLAPQWRWARVVLQNLGIHDTIKPTLVMRIALAENLDLSEEMALRAIYTQTIEDGFEFSAAFVDPGGGFTTWAVNTRTGAVTEYDNFVFNSYAQMGHHFIGASSTGLYVLDGTLDDTESIIARIKSGSAQFSGSRFTSFEAIYLGCRVSDSGRDWILKLHAGDGREYVYKFQPLNRRTTKIFVGKGLRARYFSWELITAGEDFDLDSIEFVPISAKRRV